MICCTCNFGGPHFHFLKAVTIFYSSDRPPHINESSSTLTFSRTSTTKQKHRHVTNPHPVTSDSSTWRGVYPSLVTSPDGLTLNLKRDCPVRRMSLPPEPVLRQRVPVTKTSSEPMFAASFQSEPEHHSEGFLIGPQVLLTSCDNISTDSYDKIISQPRDPLSAIPSMVSSRLPVIVYTQGKHIDESRAANRLRGGAAESGNICHGIFSFLGLTNCFCFLSRNCCDGCT
ncbi:hypothetical protein H2248_005277 [Termitomyces sp. 'cryptogamus']|nr:hypothetical protein H2248_005277 [Termitomyces sp. 'cryptogamus']